MPSSPRPLPSSLPSPQCQPAPTTLPSLPRPNPRLARAALAYAPAPGGAEGETIGISAWAASSASPRPAAVFALTCSPGNAGYHTQSVVRFRAAGRRGIHCTENGETETWVRGRGRAEAADRTGRLRCSKLGGFSLDGQQTAGLWGGGCGGKEEAFPQQTVSLYGVCGIARRSGGK